MTAKKVKLTKSQMMAKKAKLAKRRRLVRQILILLSLVIAACCVVIAISGTANQPLAKPLRTENTELQVSSDTKIEQNTASTPTPTPQTSIGDANSEVPAEEQPVKTFSVPTQYQGELVKNVKLSNKEKVVALTFDDGPWPQNTLQIVEILKKNDIRATFFLIGRMIKEYPEIAKQVVEAGHVVANHTWSHSYRWMNKAAAAREIDNTAALIYKTTGVKSLYFRPPGGILTNGVTDYAKQKNYAIIMWSNDSIDYRPSSATRLVNNVMRRVKPVEIVLMHDGGGNRSATVKALPEIISRFKKLGYKFVTIPELLEMELKAKAAESLNKAKPANNKTNPNSSPINNENQGVKVQEKDLTSSPLNSKEKSIKNEEQNVSPPTFTSDPETLPADGIQEIPDSQSPLPSPY